jgi:uncharacterized protein YdeI (YjbR/CyaY-like superfamily)
VGTGPHGYEIVDAGSRAAWRRWLERNHASASGAWLVRPRRKGGIPGIDYDSAVEEALCFGWIDGREQPLDEERLMQLVTPRRTGSAWARSNKERVARLARVGLLAPAGARAVDAAKADGSWSRYDSADALEIPEDLAAALAAAAEAARNFAAFTDAAKRAALRHLIDARRPDTRARRVADIVLGAARNEKVPS